MLRLHIYTAHPQPRHVRRAVSIVRDGGVGIFPTGNTYAFGCDANARKAVEKIRQTKDIPAKHPMSLVCSDLSQAAHHALIENHNYRILRHHLPGEYTFILPANRAVPRVVQSKVQTVGIRIPPCAVTVALVEELGSPLISTTVPPLGDAEHRYVDDPDDIVRMYGRSVDVFLDGGEMVGEPSSVIDLTGDRPEILREGAGDVSWFR